MLVDSHCHLDRLDLSTHENSLENALKAAKDNDVERMLCVCIDMDNFKNVLAIARKYDNIDASVGLHPTEEEAEPTVEKLIELGRDENIVAIGETGLDYYRCEGDVEWQRERFRNHIRAAKALKKPIIIHSRQAREDTIKIMREEGADEVRGVMHCFTEDWEMAQKAIDLGFYISISGIVTFRNAENVQTVAKKLSLEHMLVETDAPYLAPVPYRGKPNEPAYVRYVAEKVAELKEISYQEVAERTTENYFSLFKSAKTPAK